MNFNIEYIVNEYAVWFTFLGFLATILIPVLAWIFKKVPLREIKHFSLVGGLITLAVFIAAFSFGYSSKKRTFDKHRIVVLMPCNDELGDAWDDGVAQVLGLSEYFRKNHTYTKEYEFRVIDHSMQYGGENDPLANEIIEEIENGTKYFVCTMSQVSVPLSKDFRNLVNKAEFVGDAPKLISTIASSPEVKVDNENTFRFYIRSSDESIFLAKRGIKEGYKKTAAIIVEGPYGVGAAKRFNDEWKSSNGIVLNELKLNDKYEYDIVKQEIFNFKNTLQETDVIFLAHYGSGVQKVIRALYELDLKKPIIATHTLTIPNWKKPIEKILDSLRVYTCTPKFNTIETDKYPRMVYNDVIGGFMYLTIDKLVHTINKKRDGNQEFDEIWRESYPEVLRFNLDTNGDFIIELKDQ